MSFGIYFWWYRFWKNVYYKILKRKELSDFDISIITLLSGTINTFLTNPIWLINTQMSLSKDNKSLFATIKETYQKDGISEFYRGVIPNLLLLINPIINFVLYEGLKKLLLKRKFSMNAA
jgi:adenine nucleotide transporter 17